MEEKRKDLKHSQQKKIVTRIVSELNEAHPSFYYLSTVEIAGEILRYVAEPGRLSRDELELISGLSQRDIQMLLSLHSR